MSKIAARLKSLEKLIEHHGAHEFSTDEDLRDDSHSFIAERFPGLNARHDQMTRDEAYAIAAALYAFQTGKAAPDFSETCAAPTIIDGVATRVEPQD